jgi:hypothetical protein
LVLTDKADPEIAGAAVIFGAHRLGENDRALVAQLLDQHVVARREVDVVGGVAAAGRAHVLGVERILERERDAVHRHLLEIGIAPVFFVELGSGFQRVGQMAEELAHRRRAGRQLAQRRVTVEIALAGHRALAADIDRGQRVHLVRFGNADDHAELLLHFGIGRGRLHTPVFQRRAFVLVEIGQDLVGFDGLGREAQRLFAAHRAGRRGDVGAVFGDQRARWPVIGTDAVDIALHDGDAGCLPRLDRLVQLIDRRLFETNFVQAFRPACRRFHVSTTVHLACRIHAAE